MKSIRYSVLVVLICILWNTNAAMAHNWEIGKNYNIQFSSDEASGIFKTMKGTVFFDEQNLAASKFAISIDVASINTGNGLMNKHAKGQDWFDATKYPEIRFVSKKVAKNGASYVLTGDLTIRGITKEVAIPFNFKKNGNSGAFAGAFNVKRSDFKIGAPGGEVSEIIKLNLSVPVILK